MVLLCESDAMCTRVAYTLAAATQHLGTVIRPVHTDFPPPEPEVGLSDRGRETEGIERPGTRGWVDRGGNYVYYIRTGRSVCEFQPQRLSSKTLSRRKA